MPVPLPVAMHLSLFIGSFSPGRPLAVLFPLSLLCAHLLSTVPRLPTVLLRLQLPEGSRPFGRVVPVCARRHPPPTSSARSVRSTSSTSLPCHSLQSPLSASPTSLTVPSLPLAMSPGAPSLLLLSNCPPPRLSLHFHQQVVRPPLLSPLVTQ